MNFCLSYFYSYGVIEQMASLFLLYCVNASLMNDIMMFAQECVGCSEDQLNHSCVYCSVKLKSFFLDQQKISEERIGSSI